MKDSNDHNNDTGGNLDVIFRGVNDMTSIIGDPKLRKFDSTEYINLSLHQVSWAI